jgi:predicted transposase/invertase (TIGR01784 family)
MSQDYDLILKALAERYPAHFVEMVRGITVEDVQRVEKEAIAVKRESDMLFRVSEDGYEYLMAIEMQIRPDREMPRRLLEYTAMQHREFKKPVYPVIVNLTGHKKKDESYCFDCLDLMVVTFNYRQINLSDLPGRDFLRSGPVGLIPLVVLMRHDEAPEEVFAKCVQRVDEVQDEGLRADLYLGLAVLSTIKFTREIILKYIEVNKMENSPLFDGIREKWIDQGEQIGFQKGIQQGIQQAMQQSILEALEENIGICSSKIGNKLSSIRDISVLKMLHRRAVKAKTLEEFLETLNSVTKVNN